MHAYFEVHNGADLQHKKHKTKNKIGTALDPHPTSTPQPDHIASIESYAAIPLLAYAEPNRTYDANISQAWTALLE